MTDNVISLAEFMAKRNDKEFSKKVDKLKEKMDNGECAKGEALEVFHAAMKRNKENQKRMIEERNKDNRNTLRSHRIKH